MKYILYIIILLYNTSLYAKDYIKIKYLDPEMVCMVQTIYFEARGESFVGRLGVGTVVMERVINKKYPNTICGVVRQGKYWRGNPVKHRCSFSYWCDGKSEKMYDLNSFEDAVEISKMIMTGVRFNPVSGATHYHAYYVRPIWSYQMRHIFTAGKHLFYKEKK